MSCIFFFLPTAFFDFGTTKSKRVDNFHALEIFTGVHMYVCKVSNKNLPIDRTHVCNVLYYCQRNFFFVYEDILRLRCDTYYMYTRVRRGVALIAQLDS